MTDLKEQLRVYFDEISPPFDTARLMREPQSRLASDRSRVGRGLLVAAATAALILLAAGLPILLSSGQEKTVIEEPNVTTVPSETTVPGIGPTLPTIPEAALLGDAGLLECLPLDPTGWSQSEPLRMPLMNGLRLAANGDAAVAIGTGTNHVVVYSSTDGHKWEPAEGFPNVKYAGHQPPTVAGGAKGFVAVATTPFAPPYSPSSPVVVYSEDGVSWEQVDPELLPNRTVSWLSDVIAGPDGFIVVVSAYPEQLLWFSADGRTWVESGSPTDGFELLTVVAADSGWNALGDGPYAQVWESQDGTAWIEIANPNGPPVRDVQGYLRASPTVLDGDTWVVVNEFHEHGDATAWVSNDNGANWNEYPIGGDNASYETAFFDLDVTPFGLLLAGRHDFGATDTNLLAYSQDGGVTWRHCQTAVARTGTAEITQVATLGDTLIMFDDYTGTFYTWTRP